MIEYGQTSRISSWTDRDVLTSYTDDHLSSTNAQIDYKLKQKKKKGMGSEMKFGVNVAAPFVGMQRDQISDYPFAKQVRDIRKTHYIPYGSIGAHYSAASTRRRIARRVSCQPVSKL